jgi:hypothetical protein
MQPAIALQLHLMPTAIALQLHLMPTAIALLYTALDADCYCLAIYCT